MKRIDALAAALAALASFGAIDAACATDDTVFDNGFEFRDVSAPADVSASAGVNLVTVRWSPSAGAVRYRVERVELVDGVFTDTMDPDFAPGVIGTSTTSEYVDSNVELGKDYLYVVVAVNAAGQPSAKSDTSCGSPVAAGVSVPEVRPRVFMAMHASQQLSGGSIAQDAQWAYVRTCLQGVYNNLAHVDLDDQAALWRKINTRNLFGIINANGQANVPHPVFSPPALTRVEVQNADIRLIRNGVVVYSKFASLWDHITVDALRAVLATYPNADITVPPEVVWKDVFVGYALRNWVNPMTGPDGALSSPGAIAALADAGGTMVECIGGLCGSGGSFGQGFQDMVARTHANGKPVLMFVSKSANDAPQSGWLADFQREYRAVSDRGQWRSDDVVMIINYNDSYPALPMKTADGNPADAVTGMLYWALHQ